MRRVVLLLFLLWSAHTWASGYHYSSCYQPGYSYYNAGYYGGSYYQSGYYKPYVADQVYYPRYVAVVPLVSLPSYGSLYVAPPGTMPDQSVKAMPMPDKSTEILAAIGKVGSQVEALKAQATMTNARLDDLDRRMRALEARPTSTPPTPPTDPFAPVPGKLPGPKKASAPDDPIPQLFHATCAACHDATTAAKKGGDLVLFVTEFENKAAVSAEFAPKKGGVHSPAILKKMLARLTTKDAAKVMPPAKDEEGRAVPPLSDEKRKAMIAWLNEALK